MTGEPHLLRCETCPNSFCSLKGSKRVQNIPCPVKQSHSSTTSAAKTVPSDTPGSDEPLRTEKALDELDEWLNGNEDLFAWVDDTYHRRHFVSGLGELKDMIAELRERERG